ncbi:uncharacterized protein LOC125718974 [Brienomyrus brachyistius]|uniref:uncharacterized protein LOC125718974 n=1 Tax=Brienomyrus brachyistius TaxID=42636 RepID=UPI0020B385DD|nr:uncharacterized protein LOC125718974 [Brienomyrus brachyistius]
MLGRKHTKALNWALSSFITITAVVLKTDMTYTRFNLTLLIWWLSTGVLPSALYALRQVLPGSTVALPCNFTSRSEITWIRQHSEEITMLGISKISMDSTTVNTFDREDHFTATKDNLTGLINLWIKEVSEADLGIYFCSVRINGRLTFGSGEHLTFAGPTSQTSFPVCWTLLAAVTPAGALLITLLVYKLCHPADCKTSACASCQGRSDKLKTVDLHYDSLCLPDKACPPVQRCPTSNGVIYATVAFQGTARQN